MPTVPPSIKPETGETVPAGWDEQSLADPHTVVDKRRRVQQMFAAIAPSYDLNNRLHSLSMDQAWRRKAVKLAGLKATDRVVDVACGTGDLAFGFQSALSELDSPSPGQVVGVDFTFQMLPIARTKSERCCTPLHWINGDAQCLPLPDACCDVISIAFGIRNVQSPAAAFAEFHRVLRPNGRLVVLEFSLPTFAPLRALYNFYFRHVLPRTATLISGDKTGAYKYLPQSVNTFIGRGEMLRLMSAAGFGSVKQVPMTFGICVCYVGYR